MEENTLLKEQKSVEAPVPHKHHRDWLGTAIGLAVFLGGVYLLYTVFILAKDMFLVPPRVALGVTPGKPIDVDQTGNGAVSIVLRFFLLLLMAGTGSLIANRGILLYSRSRSHTS